MKRKRRLIVRDWFFYAVWYVRLRRLLKNLYSKSLLENKIQDDDIYREIVTLIKNKSNLFPILISNSNQFKSNYEVKFVT